MNQWNRGKRGIKTKAVCLLMGFVMVFASMPAFAVTKDEAQDKLDQAESEKEQLEQKLSALRQEKDDLEAYIDELDSLMNTYNAELNDVNARIESVETEIADTEVQLAEAEAEIDEQYESMKLRIQYMYENGDMQFIDMITNSENLSDFLNKAEYVKELSQYDRNMLVKMQETRQLIEDSKEKLETDRADLETLKASALEKQEQLQMVIDEKSSQVSIYEGGIAETEDEIARQQEEIEEQEKLIAEIEAIEKKRQEEERRRQEEASKNAATSNTTGSSSSAGSSASSDGDYTASASGFTWPVPGWHRISSEFGYRSNPFTGTGSEYHAGIDIPCTYGTSILAAASGQVAWANYNSSAGNWIGIDHGNGVYTVYMHNSSLLVSAGDYVTRGQVIAKAGTTGRSTGVHCHFGVRVNGTYVNPHNYVGY